MRKRIWIAAVSAVLIAAFHLLSGCRGLMNAVAAGAMAVRQTLARIFSPVPFSVAEFLCVLGIAAVLFWIIRTVVMTVRSEHHGKTLLRRFSIPMAVLPPVYLFLCLLLGSTYRADGFMEKSGLSTQAETVTLLKEVTESFAAALADTADSVPRDGNGLFSVPVDTILSDAGGVYRGVEQRFPFLELRDAKPKKVFFSRLMSRFNYTGYCFPYTGEANINVDQTAVMIPATVTHEMAHQRGIASEQEANFVGILACTESGNAVYAYSGRLFALIHLGNALSRYDRDAWFEIVYSLPESVLADLRANDDYWAQFETKAAKVSEKVYDTLLKSYGQELGVQSYGAVVDLLIAWYRAGGFPPTPGEIGI